MRFSIRSFQLYKQIYVCVGLYMGVYVFAGGALRQGNKEIRTSEASEAKARSCVHKASGIRRAGMKIGYNSVA